MARGFVACQGMPPVRKHAEDNRGDTAAGRLVKQKSVRQRSQGHLRLTRQGKRRRFLSEGEAQEEDSRESITITTKRE